MWVKICGITNPETAVQVANLKPDAIGLNFYRGSKRVIAPEQASKIVAMLPDGVEPVGLFVNHSLDEVRGITKACGINTIQLHGDESPEFCAELSEYNILRAFRVDESGLSEAGQYLSRLGELGVQLQSCLVDARVAGEFGGTGHTAPWDVLRDHWDSGWSPLVLAGGLSAKNVADAVRVVNPHGVDVASGIESAPGEQDLEQVAAFIAAARS